MKKLLFASMFFFLLAGCEKDELLPENNLELNAAAELSLKASKKDVMVPLKGEVIEVADLSYGYLDCGIPELKEPSHYDDIGGSLTHLGFAAGGHGYMYNCRMENRNGNMFVVAESAGEFMAANGDVLKYEGQIWLSFTDPALNGSAFAIVGGTGRWENAKGHFEAYFELQDNGTMLFGVDGYVTPPGKNK